MRIIHQKWRQELQPGDKLDVFIESDRESKITGWVQGYVSEINNDELNVVMEDIPPWNDGGIDRWATFIAKFETKTKQIYEWRK